MKTLKSMLGGLVLLLVCATAANAAVKPAATKLTKEDVVNIYIDAISHGDMKGLDNVLDDSLHYDVQRGENVMTLHKDDLMDYLKTNPADPAVTATTTIVEDGDRHTKIRVDFHYATYTRTDMLTLDDYGGWMITKVESSFS